MLFPAIPFSILLATIPTEPVFPTGGRWTILKESVAYGGAGSMKWGDRQAIFSSFKLENIRNDFCTINLDYKRHRNGPLVLKRTTIVCVLC